MNVPSTPYGHGRWTPALRRAVMTLRPEFFSWSIEERERFAAHLSRPDRTTLERVLLKELFGIVLETEQQVDEAIDDLDRDRQDVLNAAVLPFFGIGEDSFFLNEHFAEDDSLLNYETVADWDRADFDFQERARKEDDPGYRGRRYLGYLYCGWARLFVDDRFTYANLSMAAAHVHMKADSHATDVIGALIPHRYVPGKEHGQRVAGGYRWDMRPDAGGREAELDELRRRSYGYLSECHERLAASWDERGLGGVYLIDRFEHGEHTFDVLFTDKSALRAVRFRSFLNDCRQLERPATELTPQIEAEQTSVEAYLRQALEDIEANFDPTVARLRRKHKVVVAPEAADFLLDEE